MNKKAEAIVVNMEDYLRTEHTIECEKCHKEEAEGFIDSYEAAKSFYKSGWRIVDEILLCPKCFKNRNRNKL